MDEPKKAQDNTSEQTTETSKEEPETFTKEQVEEATRKAKSDALSEVGRLKASSEKAIKSAQAAEERVNRMLRDQDDAELLLHKDEPEKLSAIRERQTRREAEAKLATVEQELEEEKSKGAEAKQAADKHTKERNAREVATRLGVDYKPLRDSTDGSVEAMEELAKHLKPKGEPKDPLKPDSSKTKGGTGGIPTNKEQFEKWVANLSQSEFEERSPEINKMMREGKIK